MGEELPRVHWKSQAGELGGKGGVQRAQRVGACDDRGGDDGNGAGLGKENELAGGEGEGGGKGGEVEAISKICRGVEKKVKRKVDRIGAGAAQAPDGRNQCEKPLGYGLGDGDGEKDAHGPCGAKSCHGRSRRGTKKRGRVSGR